MGYASRQPSSNDMPRTSSKSRWLEEDAICDEIFLLLSGRAVRCQMCGNAVRKKYLNSKGFCPDCSGKIPENKDTPVSDFGGRGCGEDSDTE